MSTADRVAAIRARLDAAIDTDDWAVAAEACDTYEGEAAVENAPDDLTWLLDQLEATQARAAAAEARLERATAARVDGMEKGQSAFWADLANDLEDDVYRAHFEETSAEIAAYDTLANRFPQTPAHDAISDQAAARLLND